MHDARMMEHTHTCTQHTVGNSVKRILISGSVRLSLASSSVKMALVGIQ